MIASGEKKEEYREIKPYWVKRLADKYSGAMGGDFMDKHAVVSYVFKQFDIVRMKNGYAKNCPSMDVEFKGIEVGLPISGLSEEGWLDTYVFKIKLGDIIKKEGLL